MASFNPDTFKPPSGVVKTKPCSVLSLVSLIISRAYLPEFNFLFSKWTPKQSRTELIVVGLCFFEFSSTTGAFSVPSFLFGNVDIGLQKISSIRPFFKLPLLSKALFNGTISALDSFLIPLINPVFAPATSKAILQASWTWEFNLLTSFISGTDSPLAFSTLGTKVFIKSFKWLLHWSRVGNWLAVFSPDIAKTTQSATAKPRLTPNLACLFSPSYMGFKTPTMIWLILLISVSITDFLKSSFIKLVIIYSFQWIFIYTISKAKLIIKYTKLQELMQTIIYI